MRKSNNQGFTLIELIIVVTVLAILIGLLSPQYTKYVEKSRKTACDANIVTIEREYKLAAMEASPMKIDDARLILDGIIKDEHHGSVDTEASGFNNGGIYSGFCKRKGKYSCLFTEDWSNISLKCSVHGDKNLDIVILKSRLENMSFGNIPGWGSYNTLLEYFKAGHKNIDSEGIDTDNIAEDKKVYGEYGSFAKAVDAKLREQGLDTSNRSWRMYKMGDEVFNLFLTEKKITLEDAKNSGYIKCEKYDIANEKIITGEVKVTIDKKNGQEYPVIWGETFKEVK